MITPAVIFPWNENFETGLPVVDEQHRKLVDLLNKLASYLAYGVEAIELSRVFDELADYAVYHFKTEEAIWGEFMPEDEMSSTHMKTHHEFVLEVVRLKGDMDSLSSTLVDEVVSFLTHWLAFHILETDKHMAKIVLAIQQGLSLQDAKDRAVTEMSGAMRVLIETILRMYDHLSSRTLELLREIGERQRAEAGLRLSKNVIDSTSEAIFITDSECKLIETNPSFCMAVGRQHQDMMGMSIRQIMPSLFSQEKYDEIMKEAIAGGHWTGELTGRNASDELEAVWLTLSVIKNDGGEITHFVGVLSSISQLLLRHQGLLDAANHDTLTGLPNRRMLQDRFALAVTRCKRNGRLLAVCFLDLDGFKLVNDTLGHEAGDRVLRVIAARLSQIVRGDDTVARLGGDEFVLLLGEIEGESGVAQLLERLLVDVARPIAIDGESATVTASIGVTLSTDEQAGLDGLLLRADEAMYAAKSNGKSQYQFFRLQAQGVAHLPGQIV